MLQNAYLLAKIGADTAENEQHFAEICQKLATTLRVPRPELDPAAGPRDRRRERGDLGVLPLHREPRSRPGLARSETDKMKQKKMYTYPSE